MSVDSVSDSQDASAQADRPAAIAEAAKAQAILDAAIAIEQKAIAAEQKADAAIEVAIAAQNANTALQAQAELDQNIAAKDRELAEGTKDPKIAADAAKDAGEASGDADKALAQAQKNTISAQTALDNATKAKDAEGVQNKSPTEKQEADIKLAQLTVGLAKLPEQLTASAAGWADLEAKRAKIAADELNAQGATLTAPKNSSPESMRKTDSNENPISSGFRKLAEPSTASGETVSPLFPPKQNGLFSSPPSTSTDPSKSPEISTNGNNGNNGSKIGVSPASKSSSTQAVGGDKPSVDLNLSSFGCLMLQNPVENTAQGFIKLIETLPAFSKTPGMGKAKEFLEGLPAKFSNGTNESMRLEFTKGLDQTGKSVLQFKFQLDAIARGGGKLGASPVLDKIETLLTKPEDKALLESLRKLSVTPFAKQTDVRVIVRSDGSVGLGAMFVKGLKPLGNIKNAFWVMPQETISPITKKPDGLALRLGTISFVDVKGVKGALIGAGPSLNINIKYPLATSQLRRDATGQVGIDTAVQGKPHFLPIPGAAEFISATSHNIKDIKFSHVPSVSAEIVAKELLNSSDPKLIENLKKAGETAKTAEEYVNSGSAILGAVAPASAGLGLLQQIAPHLSEANPIRGLTEGITRGVQALKVNPIELLKGIKPLEILKSTPKAAPAVAVTVPLAEGGGVVAAGSTWSIASILGLSTFTVGSYLAITQTSAQPATLKDAMGKVVEADAKSVTDKLLSSAQIMQEPVSKEGKADVEANQRTIQDIQKRQIALSKTPYYKDNITQSQKAVFDPAIFERAKLAQIAYLQAPIGTTIVVKDIKPNNSAGL